MIEIKIIKGEHYLQSFNYSGGIKSTYSRYEYYSRKIYNTSGWNLDEIYFIRYHYVMDYNNMLLLDFYFTPY